MKITLFRSILILFLLLAVGCDDNQDGNYEGVGKIIAARNELRYQIAQEKQQEKKGSLKTQKKVDTNKKESKTKSETDNSDELFTKELRTKKIKIVTTDGNDIIAYGKAYFNKQGSIAHVRITKEKKQFK